jgi:hypothetical protein
MNGGSYCKINLTKTDKEKALQTICSIMDKCYKCVEKGHFAKDCGIINVDKHTSTYCCQTGMHDCCDENLCNQCRV